MKTETYLHLKSTFYYALVIFIGAFLLFQVQPIISKFILPWFGGTPAVWTVCMLFFQVGLFAGYLYAHLIASQKIKPKTQVMIHGSILLLAALLVIIRTILPGESMKPVTENTPVTQILLILFIAIGLPYFVLAATSPLLQYWYGRLNKGKEPYVLYSYSNIGSLLALLTYPVLVEPLFRLKIQSWIWSICFFIFAVGCSVLMWFSAREEQVPAMEDPPRRAETSSKKAKKKKHGAKSLAVESAPILTKKECVAESAPSTIFQKVLWFVLPMVASILLLAVTNQLCTDVSSGPFLWILPLSIYLITFILTFSGWRFVYNRYVFFIALVVGTIAILRDMQYPHNNPLIIKIILYCAVLLCGCIAAHGELYRLRPRHEKLTSFYLSISAGGAAGGIFVVVIAPLLFVDYFELHLAIIAIMALLIIALYHETRGKSIRISTYATLGISSIILLIIAGALINQANKSTTNLSEIRRNFFGIVRVYEVNPNQPLMREYRLMHGNTEHGMQFVHPSRRQNPTLYFSSQSGIGVALNEYIRPPSMHVGIIGLGIGTIAAYAQPGDVYRFYDINPDIIALAQDTRYFTYIEQARQKGATVDIVPGDARLSMEHEAKTGQGNQYDILALDAFSSDAIPAHLLTKEAFDIYFRLLKQNGILAVHVTNRNVDLAPVIFAAAEYYKYHSIFIMNNYIPQEEIYLSRWILLTNNPEFVKSRYTGNIPIPFEKRLKEPWTDDFYNLWRLMKERKLFK